MRPIEAWALVLILSTMASCGRDSPHSETPEPATATKPEAIALTAPDIETDSSGIPLIATEELDPLLRDALARARAQVEQQPESAEAWRALAHLFSSHRFLRAADLALVRTLERAPGDARALYLRSSIAGESGDIERAADLLEQVLEIEPGYLPARFALGQMELRLDRIEDARANFESLRSSPRSEDVPWGEFGLGLTEQRAERTDVAVRHLEKASAALAGLYQPNYALMMAYRDSGKVDQAKELLARLEASGAQPGLAKPDDPWLDEVLADRFDLQRLIRIGNRLLEEGRVQEAEAQFREVLRYDPASFDAHQNLGVLLTRTDRLEEARTELERAVEIAPDNPDAHLSLGLTYAALGYPDLALNAIDQSLQLRPGDPRALRVQQAIHQTLRSLD